MVFGGHASRATRLGKIRPATRPPRPRGRLEAHRVYWKKGFKLYDLSKDPSEQHNLADKMPEKVANLKAKLQAFKKDNGAILPIVNPKPDPSFKKG